MLDAGDTFDPYVDSDLALQCIIYKVILYVRYLETLVVSLIMSNNFCDFLLIVFNFILKTNIDMKGIIPKILFLC